MGFTCILHVFSSICITVHVYYVYVLYIMTVVLLALEKLKTFSQFYDFHNNNNNNFPYISISNYPDYLQNVKPFVKTNQTMTCCKEDKYLVWLDIFHNVFHNMFLYSHTIVYG